ncbi:MULTISPECIES: hypothetical protein [unclassified Micromonospora]|uniref:hypothetical protein n=1 Tax=unclassified Micromonospora TaxID=2617518 RepID=UPI003A8BF521
MTDRDNAIGRVPLEEEPAVAAAVEDDTTVPLLVTDPDTEQDGPDFQPPDGRSGSARVRTGAEQPWDAADLAVAKGGDGSPGQVDRARQELERDGAAAIERTVP